MTDARSETVGHLSLGSGGLVPDVKLVAGGAHDAALVDEPAVPQLHGALARVDVVVQASHLHTYKL